MSEYRTYNFKIIENEQTKPSLKLLDAIIENLNNYGIVEKIEDK